MKIKNLLGTGLLGLVIALFAGGGLALASKGCDDIVGNATCQVENHLPGGGSGGGSSSSGGGSSGGSSTSGGSTSSTSSSSSGRSTTKPSDDSTSHTENETTTEHGTETEHETEAKHQEAEKAELHQKGLAEVAELRKEHSQSAQERKQKCEIRKNGLTTKFARLTSNSQAAQNRITSILDKAVAFQQSKNLQVDNFTALVSAAQAAGATSASSITTLKTVTPTIDCNSASVAEDVATFKAAVSNTRDDLKTYRADVKAVVQALEKVAPETETNDGGNHQ